MVMKARHKKWIANLLITIGVLVLAYPVGTWAFTWWEQRGLEKELERTHPVFAQEPETYFEEDMTSLREQQQTLREIGAEVERGTKLKTLKSRAEAFADRMEGEGGAPLGRLIIPKIDVEVVMVQGTGRDDLREGPGHWPETPMPGMESNFVLSGHRTTYGAPFLRLDKLAAGDVIKVMMPYAAATYEVTRSIIVYPDEVETVAPKGVEEISLITCHPIYSARQRLIIQAEMTTFKLLNEDAASTVREKTLAN